jgi:hypothetical protein
MYGAGFVHICTWAIPSEPMTVDICINSALVPYENRTVRQESLESAAGPQLVLRSISSRHIENVRFTIVGKCNMLSLFIPGRPSSC